MTAPRSTDQLLHAFLADGLTELPDRAYEAVRGEIHGVRQRGLAGPWRVRNLGLGRWVTVAVAAILVVALAILDLRPGGGPGGIPTLPAANETPTPSAAPSTEPTPARPTGFSSPLYGYTLTMPAGWISAAAVIPWDGIKQSGPDAESDKFVGPAQVMSWAFAGPYAGNLAEFVQDRIAANHRDHADTCPNGAPEINEPASIAGQPGTLLGWNCGAVINIAVAVRAGIGYCFVFRDLGVPAASDPADSALFQSILDSVVFPS
jgi:hypothetical protein